MSEEQTGVVDNSHLPPPSDLTFKEALQKLKEAIEKVLSIIPKDSA